MVIPDSPAEITITTNEKDFRCMLTRQSDIRVEPEEVQLAGLTVSQQSKQDVGNYQESLHIRRIVNEPTMNYQESLHIRRIVNEPTMNYQESLHIRRIVNEPTMNYQESLHIRRIVNEPTMNYQESLHIRRIVNEPTMNYQESLHIRRIVNEPTMTLEVIHQPDSTDVRIYQTSIDTCFEDRPRIFNLPSLHYKHAGGDMIETRAGTIP